MSGVRLTIFGRVQGVGFRPFIYNLATEASLKGAVFNRGAAVIVELTAVENIPILVAEIRNQAPSLSRIETIEIDTKCKIKKYKDFKILPSQDQDLQKVYIPTDVAICPSCEAELGDPRSRRFAYPFISCTQCGPRYSIMHTLPFDRGHTSMRDFPMCEACKKEYRNPKSRFFHAQTLSCKACGPKLSLLGTNKALTQEGMILFVVEKLKEGAIVALKGIGGYHLLCDATNKESVALLRRRKQRPHKPFAVMVENLNRAQAYAVISDRDSVLLRSKERPVVLLVKKENQSIAPNVAADNDRIGIFLPYTPMHKLLLEGVKKPLIATSANVHGEPLAQTQEEILRMEGLWDYCLDHDREIVNGCDDSVVFTVNEHKHTIRLARGYAPQSFHVSKPFPQKVLAVGANQKSSIALALEDQIILSAYIGDLDSVAANRRFERQIERFYHLYNSKPQLIVCDKHPAYVSHKWAYAQEPEVKTVQHHHAHILSVMLEKQIEGEVLGIAFDGTGYGDDHTLWGGEFIKVFDTGYERVAHLKPLKLLGADKAVKEPRRLALSLLFECYGKRALTMDHPCVQSFSKEDLNVLWLAFDKDLQAPASSSMGRLFDAVASLANVSQIQSFEGQSGMIMETYFDEQYQDTYPFAVEAGVIDYLPMIKEILTDQEPTRMITKFFHTVVKMIETVSQWYDFPLVCSGGVFQNPTLVKLVQMKFPDAIFAEDIPSNDAGIALGQIAAIQEKSL